MINVPLSSLRVNLPAKPSRLKALEPIPRSINEVRKVSRFSLNSIIEFLNLPVRSIDKLLNKFAGDLIGQDDVQMLLDNLANSSPNLVQSAVPKLVPVKSAAQLSILKYFIGFSLKSLQFYISTKALIILI